MDIPENPYKIILGLLHACVCKLPSWHVMRLNTVVPRWREVPVLSSPSWQDDKNCGHVPPTALVKKTPCLQEDALTL